MNSQAIVSWLNQVPNQTHSALLHLPGAIRSRIWEQVLGGHDIHIGVNKSISVSTWDSPKEFLALTETCRQVRVETKDTPFLKNEFGGPLKAMKLAISGCLFDTAQVLKISSVRIHLGQDDIKNDGQEARLKGPVKDLLQVMCGLPDLEQLTLELIGEARDEAFTAKEQTLAEDVSKIFEHRTGTNAVQVNIVPQ